MFLQRFQEIMTQPLFFLTRIPKRENQFGETCLCHFGVPFGLRLSIQHFLAFIPLSRSCTSSWSIVGSVQTSIWLSYVYGISVGMKYMSFRVFGYDILRHLITKATFHISSIRHCVVMINMRLRKAENGLKRWKWRKRRVPIWFSRLGIRVKKKSGCVIISWNSCKPIFHNVGTKIHKTSEIFG